MSLSSFIQTKVKPVVYTGAALLYLADVAHVYNYITDYYAEDLAHDERYDDDRLEEDKKVLALYQDDCSPSTIITKEMYEAALASLNESLVSNDPKQGLFDPSDPAIPILRESVVFLGGGRAAFMQLAHPFVAQGIRLHSKLEFGIRQRFIGTFKYMFGMYYGTRDEMFRASRTVRALHDRVKGEIDEKSSNLVFQPNNKFNAHQVNAVRWVAATLLETTVFQYEMMVRGLSEAEKDHLVLSLRKTLCLFGVMPSEHDPRTWKEFRRMMSAMFRSPAFNVCYTAKETAEFLLLPPSRLNEPLLGTVWWVTFVKLPPKMARAYYARDVNYIDRVIFALFNGFIRFVYRLLPGSFRWLSAYMRYRERTQGLWPHERLLSAISAKFTNFMLDQLMPPRDPEATREKVKEIMAQKWSEEV